MRNYLRLGDWNSICDVCGFKFKASQMQKRWDGLMVCKKDYELRNPLDFIRPPQENVTNPWNRPEGTDSFVSVASAIIEETSVLPIQTELELSISTET